MLLLTTATRTQTLPLAAATLVGRAAGCLVRVDDPAIPAHWLELRWRGDSWAWRALAAEDRTRGTGAFLEGGWRRMDATEGRGTRVSLGTTSVELLSSDPPAPFAWDLLAERPLHGDALEQVAEVRDGALLPFGAEGDPAQALRDGQVWLHEEASGVRALRAHVPDTLPHTLNAALDLRRGDITAHVDLGTNTLTLARGGTSVEVRGACVRAIAVYARAREGTPDGWLSAADVWALWVEFGGAATSPIDAVAWERGRVRRLLDKAGVAGLDALIERRKEGTTTRTRLSDRVVTLVVT